MRVTNGEESGGAFSELLRMQADFQARLTDETMRYLRRLQGVLEPHAPGTVVQPDGDKSLSASVRPGGTATLSVDVENRQRVHTVVAASLTPLVADSGTTWFPVSAATPPYGFVAPEETLALTVTVTVPDDVPPGRYRGLLVLRGFGNGGLPVVIDVATDIDTDIDTEGAME